MRSTTSHHRSGAPSGPPLAAVQPDLRPAQDRPTWSAAVRGFGLAAGTAAAAGALCLGAHEVLGPVPADASIDLIVAATVLAAAALALAVQAFGCLLLTATHVARASGHSVRAVESLARRCTPAVMRRVVAVGVGAGLGLLGPASLAGAAEPDLGWTVTTASTTTTAPAELPQAISDGTGAPMTATLPSTSPSATAAASPSPATALPRTVAAPQPAVSERAETTDTAATSVMVQPGDTLWSIAAARLGTASDTRVSAEWPRWYSANRAVIGADPDLIRPGQILVAPATTGDPS